MFPLNLVSSIGNIYDTIINDSEENCEQTVKYTVRQFHSNLIFLNGPKNRSLGKIKIIKRPREYQLYLHVKFQFKSRV